MVGFDPTTSLLWADNHPQFGPLRVKEVEDSVKRSSAELHRRVFVCVHVLRYVLCPAWQLHSRYVTNGSV